MDERTYGSSRSVSSSLWNGLLGRCPNCAHGPIFGKYLKVRDTCPHCGQELHHHQADDAPPYFAILIVGHLVVSFVLAVEMAWRPPLWVHAAIWLPLTIAMTLAVLQPIKGAIVAYQWALRMHGFEYDASGQRTTV